MNPMSGGSPTPDYFGDSEVLVSGGGIFDYDFKVSSGINVAVDAIRIQFLEPGTLAVLKEYVVPVEYYWSSAGLQPHLSALDYETGLVSVVMQYESTVQMRVILSPESDGPVNDWEVSESPVLLGGGSRSQSTGILDPEDGTVTGVRVRVLAYPSDDELHNFVVPIDPPVFRKAAHHFEEVRIAPATEGEIPFHQSVTVDLDWFSEEPADKVLKVYPVVESGPTSNYVKSPAGLAGTSGPAAVEFCLYNEEVYHITGVQLRLYKQSDMSVLAEYVYPVDLWHIPAVPVTTDVTCPSGDDVHVYGGVAPATTWRIEMGDNLSGPWQYSYNGSVHYLDPDAMIFHDRRFYRISNYTTIDWGKP